MNKVNLNKNWNFKLLSTKGSDWRELDLPHDWAIEGTYDEHAPDLGHCGFLGTGFATYQKRLILDKSWDDKKLFLYFHAAFRDLTLYIDNIEVGSRQFAWFPTFFDISNFCQGKNEIQIEVKIDNSHQPAARWYTGSGIYGDVELIVKDSQHFSLFETFIQPSYEESQAIIKVENKLSIASDFEIEHVIYDKDDNIIVSNRNSELTTQLTLDKFNLWSPESPYLYSLECKLYCKGELCDIEKHSFGIRNVRWETATGFYLNDKNIKIKGACNHNDAGALGVAVPEKVMRQRLQQLKDMGGNAIRTSHNPQIPKFYELCDEMGLMVLDEYCDGWNIKVNEEYSTIINEVWEQDLSDFIKCNRNHPSIIAWSVGNETHTSLGELLVAKVHELDSGRLVTGGQTTNECMDIFGLNGQSEQKGFAENHIPTKPFIATEAPHTWQTRGFYRTQTWYRDGDKIDHYDYDNLTEKEIFIWNIPHAEEKGNRHVYMSSYDNAVVRISARQNIVHSRDLPWYAGEFRWTLHDYLGESLWGHHGWPFKAFGGGAIDLCGFKKDLYYLYQSQWSSTPMLHIFPHWTHHEMEKDTLIPIWAYSNCDFVELFLNEESLGIQSPGRDAHNMQCQWLVPWQKGTIKAIGYKDGKEFCIASHTTSEKASKLQLISDNKELGKADDITQVTIKVTDDDDNFYPYADNKLIFELVGDATLKALDNGQLDDTTPHCFVTEKKCFMGMAKAYIVSNGNRGTAILKVNLLDKRGKILDSQELFIRK